MGEPPFTDVRRTPEGFSIPELKWRELLFVGALRHEGGCYLRDPARPLPPFEINDLFPVGVRFEAVPNGPRVTLRRLPDR